MKTDSPIPSSRPASFKELLRGATQGKWSAHTDESSRPAMHSDWRVFTTGSTPDRIAPIARMELRGVQSEANAQYIARLNPEVMALVLEALEGITHEDGLSSFNIRRNLAACQTALAALNNPTP